MKALILIVLAVALYAIVGIAAAGNPDHPSKKYKALAVGTAKIREAVKFKPPPRKPLKLPSIQKLAKKLITRDLSSVKKQHEKSQKVINFWEGKGRWLRAPRHGKCWDVPWQRSCIIARHSYKLHLTLATAAQRKLWYWLPATGDFVTAVDVAQRVFPGTKGIVLNCADSEGGRGAWVPNTRGSGAGGWMQFMESSFWRMFYAAKAEAEEKGFYVPAEAASWYSPLGQALAGAWGMLNRRSEWSGSGCR